MMNRLANRIQWATKDDDRLDRDLNSSERNDSKLMTVMVDIVREVRS